jgi:hypothetical protein
MLWLTVRNYLVPQNICRYIRGVAYISVVITGFDCTSLSSVIMVTGQGERNEA